MRGAFRKRSERGRGGAIVSWSTTMASDIQLERRAAEQRGGVATKAPLRGTHPRHTTSSGGWWIRAALAVGVIAAVVTAASFMLGGASPKTTVPNCSTTIARRDLDVTVTEEGTLESSNNTEVRCKVKGASSTVVWIIENGTEVKPGDVLVRLDTSTIEDNINTTEDRLSDCLATYAQSESDVAVAEINITEYLEGTYRLGAEDQRKGRAHRQSQSGLGAEHSRLLAKEMFRKGYISKLEVEGNEFSLQQAELELEVKETDVDVLKRYTRGKADPGPGRHSEGKESQVGLRQGGTRPGKGEARSREAATRELRHSS